MKRLVLATVLTACAPSSVRTEVTLRAVPPAAPSAVVAEPPPKWGERAYHLRLGLWELTGKLHDGRGTMSLAYHDGSTGPIAMVLDRTISCELRDRRTIVAVHLVSEEPSQAMGRKWYAIYAGAKLLGAIVADDELACDHGDVFLFTNACRRAVTITDTVDFERTPTCAESDEVDY